MIARALSLSAQRHRHPADSAAVCFLNFLLLPFGTRLSSSSSLLLLLSLTDTRSDLSAAEKSGGSFEQMKQTRPYRPSVDNRWGSNDPDTKSKQRCDIRGEYVWRKGSGRDRGRERAVGPVGGGGDGGGRRGESAASGTVVLFLNYFRQNAHRLQETNRMRVINYQPSSRTTAWLHW